jgi:hypothetical protein
MLISIIITPPTSWRLLNNKFVYAAAISASPRVNGKTLYATAAAASSSHLLPASRARDIDTKHIIATYELSYQKGKVIALGVYADDIITNNKFDKYFDNLLLRYAL